MKKNFTKTIGLLVFLFCQTFHGLAQSGSISGKISDENGEALIGASVAVKGTASGTTSANDGSFTIRGLANGNYTVAVSYTGFGRKEVAATVPGAALQITMEEASILDEVIVTGVFDQRTRLESSIAITTLKAKDIERLAPVSAADLLKNIPGVFVNSSLGEIRNTVYSRGVSVGSNDGASGFYYVSMQEDGLPVTNATFVNFGPDYFLRADLNIGRLEAVRGGTASILGSNAPGGIFNYVSKTGGQTFGGSAAVKLGLEGKNQPYYRADVNFGGPMNADKSLTYNVGGFFRVANGARYPGYPMNNGGQLKANVVKSYQNGSLKFYGKFLNDKNAWYEFLPTLGFDDPKLPAGVEQTNSVLPGPVQASFKVNNTSETIDYDSRDKIHSTDKAIGLNWEHHFGGDWTVTNNARFSDKRAVWNTSAVVYPFATDGLVFHAILGTLFNFGTYTFKNQRTGQVIGKVKSEFDGMAQGPPFKYTVLENNFPGAAVQANSLFFNPLLWQNFHMTEFIDQLTLNKKLKTMSFTGGLMYAKSKADLRGTFGGPATYGTISSPRPDRVNITLEGLDGKTYQVTDANGVAGAGKSAAVSTNDVDQNQLALFFGHNWSITPALNLDWGLRFENYKISGTNNDAVAGTDTVGGFDKTPLTLYDNGINLPGPDFKYDHTLNTVSFSAGLNYKLTDKMAVFGRFSQGAKAPDMGLFNDIDTDFEVRNTEVKAQKTQQIELGLKARSGRTTFFVTPFYSLLSNVYQQQNGQETADLSTTYSAPALYNSYKTLGIELESDVNLTKNFDVRAVLTFQKSEATKFQSWIFNQNGKSDDKIQDFSGNETDNAANAILSITPTYSTDKFYANLNWYYMGKRAANVPNAFELPAYSQFNLALGYDFTQKFRLSANINNLLNQIGVMGWSAPGGFPAALDRQGFTKTILDANPNAVYSTLSIPPRAYFLTANYKF